MERLDNFDEKLKSADGYWKKKKSYMMSRKRYKSGKHKKFSWIHHSEYNNNDEDYSTIIKEST